MSKATEFWFDRSYWLLSLLIFVVVVLRCILVPFSHDEVATFVFYIQPGRFWPFFSHPDANGHFLINALSWICFKVGGSSPFILRIPCIAGYIVLVFAVSKFVRLLKNMTARIVLASAFLLSYHFISFYSLCRGYGLSMSLLLFGLYYFFTYQRYFNFRHFSKFILFTQLALSANLTLVPVLGITTAILVLFQIRQKVFFRWQNILLLLLHAGLIYYWIRYGFYLKEQGALYYGEGDSYWRTTFRSLIDLLLFPSIIVYALAGIIMLAMFICLVVVLFRKKLKDALDSFFIVSFFTFLLLIFSFWMMKKLLGINYPEDRTGLFFYLLFIVSFSFLLNEWTFKLRQVFSGIAVFFLVHFISEINLRSHPWRIYETMPRAFFKALVEDQKNTSYPITVAGHRVREFFYGFLNYNSKDKLSHITAPEALQMNADYALAYEQDRPYYEKYYDEIAEDKDWGFRLLKRKKAVGRKLLLKVEQNIEVAGEHEYINAFEKLDTAFADISPLIAEFEISVTAAPVPWEAWLVLQVDDALSSNNIFIRAPLNLIKYDWNGTSRFRTVLLSPTIPKNIKRIVAYIWNIRKEKIQLRINSFKLYQTEGEGVNEVSPAKI